MDMTTFQNTPDDTQPGGDDAHDATLTAVLDAYAQGGFTSSFVVTDESTLECVACGVVSAPTEVPMSSLRRLEGASDPDDMVAVVALTCPACAAQASAVLGFGPMASLQDAEVLMNLRDHRGDEKAPGNSGHGETTGDESPSASAAATAGGVDPIDGEAATIDARSEDAADQIAQLVEHAEELGRDVDDSPIPPPDEAPTVETSDDPALTGEIDGD